EIARKCDAAFPVYTSILRDVGTATLHYQLGTRIAKPTNGNCWYAYSRGDLARAKEVAIASRTFSCQAFVETTLGDKELAKSLLLRDLVERETAFPNDNWVWLNTPMVALAEYFIGENDYD